MNELAKEAEIQKYRIKRMKRTLKLARRVFTLALNWPIENSDGDLEADIGDAFDSWKRDMFKLELDKPDEC